MKFINLDNKGQLSLEYILGAMIVILIISLISVPILLNTIDYSNDIIDSLNAKNEMNKITDAIDFCYSSGKGSRKIVFTDLYKSCTIKFSSNGQKGIASINLNLSKETKNIMSDFQYGGLNKNLELSKGFNKILVQWNEETGDIEVKKII